MPSFIPVDFNPFEETREIEKITFTNEPQREIWLSCVIGGDEANLSYNESVSLKIEGNLNVAALKKAVSDLILRHEALRSTISPNGETLIIYRDLPVTFELKDISGSADRENIFASFLKQEMDAPMHLQDGPLFKVALHKTGSAEYYFTIFKHHIIGDGWSTGIILEDLSKMYNAHTGGAELVLEPASQISDYASAQASFRTTPAYQQTEDYWLNQYKDDVPVVDLPTDRPRLSPRSYKGNRIDRPLTKETVAALKKIGAKTGASLVTTLLAAFEVLLYNETHQADIVVGLPASGQAASGLTNVVGHCVNLLPLKTHIDAGQSFADYLKKRKKEVLDAYDHQRLTFGELLKKLYIQRDASRIALVPVMFNIDMGMDNAVAFDGLSFQLISNPRSYENFELYLNATGSKDGIILEWSYNTDLFDAKTIEAFHAKYYSILEGIISDAATSISDLVGAKESIVNGPEINIPQGQTVITLIEDAVKQYANKNAVTFNGRSLTYKQLGEKTDQLAAYLVQSGIGSGDIVAISLDRSIEMLVSLLAVLKAGGTYLPLDPEYPSERIEFMLKDSSAKALLTSRNYKGKYPGAAREIIVEDIWPKLEGQKHAIVKASEGKDLAYVLYTSGSTGKPKGVEITHHNLANFLLSMRSAPGINDKDRLLAITSISFDIAGLELYLPLISGAELIIADNDATKDGRILLKILEEQKISMMQATPSSWQMILDSGWEKKYPVKILSGGEALPPELADKLLGLGSELWNMYGPTETTIWSTIKKIAPNDKQLTIGLPVGNTQVYVMNEQGHPVPVNQQGEIYIGGDGVASGYLNRAELTNEKFVTDTYSKIGGRKLYRTGDLGKMLNNGEILCIGRIDHQIKIRGHRIELGEIETAISKQQGVKQAVVIAAGDTPADKRLVAYVTLEEGQAGSDGTSWKDRWDTLYETGAKDKQNALADKQNIDGTLLEHLQNSDELKQQLAEWLQTSIARIKEINAKRIYEIGSGAGQLLFELAPVCEQYIATDYAAAAINNINERLNAEPQKWKHVKASVAGADDFSAVGNAPVDLVLINSVAQYFSSGDYLLGVIRKAAAAIKQGCIFIGDMQGMSSLEMYHAADYLPRATDLTTVGAFRGVVENRVRIEEELVADPMFFYLLPKLIPQITGVDVQLRKGKSLNETTKYHYDVWLYVSTPVEVAKTQVAREWKDIKTITNLEQILADNAGAVVEVKNIVNSRTAKDYKLLQLINAADTNAVIAGIKHDVAQTNAGIHPDLFWEVGGKLGRTAHVRWSTDGTDGLFDVVFVPASGKLRVPEYTMAEGSGSNINDYVRTPIGKNEVRVPKELIENWKSELRETLPAYMVPDDIIALANFPLTPNAKIDRKALPKPQRKTDATTTEGRRELTANEQLITDIWAEILGAEGLRPTDDFFQLGGHSLLAVKVMVAIEKKTGKRLPIATLFNNSTIEKLAAQLADDETAKKWNTLVPIRTTGNNVPLFLIHGGGLNILLFKSISEYFSDDQPLYGLQALGLNHEINIPSSIEGIAKLYVSDIIAAYPEGPYALAGYSLGGFLAIEIAKQLKEMGKQIHFLGIMDTYAGNNTYVGDKFERAKQKIKRQFHKVPHFAKIFLTSPKEAFEYQMVVVQKKFQKLQTTGALIPKDTFTEYEAGIYRKYSDALDAYVLTAYDLEVTLFRVEKRLYFVDDPKYLGWSRFALKGVNVREVPGDHKTFLYPPFSKQFASIMQKALDEVNSNRAPRK